MHCNKPIQPKFSKYVEELCLQAFHYGSLVNQLKKKIQQEESEEDDDDDDDDESEDDEEEISGSGSSALLTNKKSVPQVALRSERFGENAERFGNNVHPNLKNSSLSAGKCSRFLLV